IGPSVHPSRAHERGGEAFLSLAVRLVTRGTESELLSASLEPFALLLVERGDRSFGVDLLALPADECERIARTARVGACAPRKCRERFRLLRQEYRASFVSLSWNETFYAIDDCGVQPFLRGIQQREQPFDIRCLARFQHRGSKRGEHRRDL